MTDLTLSEKKKIVPKGKKLNPMKIKHKAEEILGSDFRKILREKMECSSALITQALKGEAPFALFTINEIIKQETSN